MLHIIDRFLIHFFCSMGIVTGSLLGLRTLIRKKKNWTFPQNISLQLFICCLFVVLVAFIREPFDVAHNIADPWWKSYVDLTSWVLGSVFSFIAIKRLVLLEWK